MTQSDKAAAAAVPAPDPRHPPIDPTTVVGWGVDADPENDPTWPMRDRAADDGPGMNWDPPAAQAADVESGSEKGRDRSECRGLRACRQCADGALRG